MRQVLFEIPAIHLKIFGYGVMLFVAFLAAMHLAARLARRNRLDPEIIFDLALWIFLGGMLGARLFYVVQYWGDRITSWTDIFKIWEGGIVLYGSILGGTAAFFLYWAWRRFPLRPTLDALAPALALGIAIGRLGCFLNGCCYGDRCDLPWAVAFPPNSPPWWDQVRHDQLPEAAPFVEAVRRGTIPPETPWSHLVHPTQIYSTIGCTIITLLLLTYYPLRRRDGEVMALLMVTYPIHRFLVERLRNDEGAFLAGMTISQNASIVVFLAGLAFWAYLSRQPATRYADTAPELDLDARPGPSPPSETGSKGHAGATA